MAQLGKHKKYNRGEGWAKGTLFCQDGSYCAAWLIFFILKASKDTTHKICTHLSKITCIVLLRKDIQIFPETRDIVNYFTSEKVSFW